VRIDSLERLALKAPLLSWLDSLSALPHNDVLSGMASATKPDRN